MPRRLLIALASLTAMLLLSNCSKKADGAYNYPKTIHFAYATSAEMAEDQLKRIDLLRNYLSKQVGVPFEIERVVSYAPTIEALCAGKADIAGMGPFAYILATQKNCVEPLVVRGNADGTPAGYRSIIATHKDSGIHSIEEMKAQSHRLTLSFNDPASTSGHLVPRAGLEAMGINPERDFKKVMFAPSHLASALTLKAEKVDVACMMESILPRLIDTGKMKKDDVRILWTSALMPTSPVAVRKGLPPELKQRMQEAFINMDKKDPELFKQLGLVARTGGTRYIVATDAMYDGLRETARKVPNVNLLDK